MGEIDRLVPIIEPLNPNAADHLRRSGESVLYNTAEGVVAWRPKVKLAVYEIARRESNEVRAILRRLVAPGIVTTDQTRRAYNLAGAIVGMLIAAAIKIEKRKSTDPGPQSTPAVHAFARS